MVGIVFSLDCEFALQPKKFHTDFKNALVTQAFLCHLTLGTSLRSQHCQSFQRCFN